ncbi:MAG TPA: BtpA/SgcQ family protein [Desulfurococcales archaeon]|nr:BtpA/SgcQ family protein [Desulfurococcales archaeon]
MVKTLFNVEKPIIGVVHLPPLPGSPLYRGNFNQIVERAISDSLTLMRGGVDGLIIENYGDKPYRVRVREPETIAALTLIAYNVKRGVRKPLGISLLRNSGPEALAIAYVVGAEFIRVNAYGEVLVSPEGILEPVAREVQELKCKLNANVKVFADIICKHATPLHNIDIADLVHDITYRCLADAIIVSGSRTGLPPDVSLVEKVKSHTNKPVIIGSGITINNIREYWDLADGFIVGTYFKVNGVTENNVDERRVKEFMNYIVKLRSNR